MHRSEIPTAQEAVAEYRQQGGTLTDPRVYGHDPLDGNIPLSNRRDAMFLERVSVDLQDILGHLLINNTTPFEQAILQYISITEELSS